MVHLSPVRSFAAVLLMAALPSFALAANKEPTLKAGDPAPKLSIDKWLKGDPIKEFEKGKVYVIEFWATWCGPCRTSIPHVTKLQKKYKDKGLVVIGVDIWERDLAKVEPFVKEMGDKMDYAVCTEAPIPDSPNRGRMAIDWMDAAGRNGIPCSFIVDKESKIAWIGHPMRMDRPLAKIFEGTFDAAAERLLDGKIAELNAKAMMAMSKKEFDEAIKIRDQIIDLDPTDAESQQLGKMMIYLQKGDMDAASKVGAALLAKGEADPESMLPPRIASLLLNSAAANEKADKVLALKAAKVAYSRNQNMMSYQRLLAQAYAANGQYEQAIPLQEKVVEQLNGPLKVREQKSLDEYKAKVKSPTSAVEK